MRFATSNASSPEIRIIPIPEGERAVAIAAIVSVTMIVSFQVAFITLF
jgi:hypothetical protein